MGRANELYLKIKGNPKYLFVLMDDQTRFCIAQQVADSKYTSNIQPLFGDAKQITGKRPNTVITDGAQNFADAFKKKSSQSTIQELDIFRTFGYKATITTTKWSA